MKIFGIGLNKTGTTTLGQCGQELGFRCTTCDIGLLEDFVEKKEFKRIKNTVANFDFFEDWPWPLMYKQLDFMYPDSKFILTVRKSEKVWIESLKSHSMRTHPTLHCRSLAYGYNFPHKYEKEHVEIYRKHNNDVREYFKGRDNFLEICWENGDDYEKLCNFLGVEVLKQPVPHANKGSQVFVNEEWFELNKKLIEMDESPT
jgi:hypothetical protein